MSAIFGPAGNAESFPYKSSVDAPRWLAELGLDCYEYPVSYTHLRAHET